MRFEFMSRPITDRASAEKFIKQMVESGQAFHWDEDPADIINIKTGEKAFTDEEVSVLRERLCDLQLLPGFSWNEVFEFTNSLDNVAGIGDVYDADGQSYCEKYSK